MIFREGYQSATAVAFNNPLIQLVEDAISTTCNEVSRFFIYRIYSDRSASSPSIKNTANLGKSDCNSLAIKWSFYLQNNFKDPDDFTLL